MFKYLENIAFSMTRVETVAIVYQPPRILLGVKKRNLGKGRYNGAGGGVEDTDRDIFHNVVRETKEEWDITLLEPDLVGRILFKFDSDEQDHDVYIFRVGEYEGEPKETEEMTFEWFDIDEIPYDKMWDGDKYWLPILLDGGRFLGSILFTEDHKVRSKEIKRFEDREIFEKALETFFVN